MESSPWREDRWFVAEGQMFGVCTTSHAGLMRVEFPDNISLLIKSANNVLGKTFLLREESSQQRFSIWERQARLLWWLWGKHPKPKGSPVEAAVCVRKCRRPSQAEDRSGWENSQSRAGQPTAGKSAENRCHQTLASRGLPFSSKPKKGGVLADPRPAAPDSRAGQSGSVREQMFAQLHLCKHRQEAASRPSIHESYRSLRVALTCHSVPKNCHPCVYIPFLK